MTHVLYIAVLFYINDNFIFYNIYMSYINKNVLNFQLSTHALICSVLVSVCICALVYVCVCVCV